MPRLTADQRRAAVGQFERARQVIKSGNIDYGLQLLLDCCKIDPANLIYRQELRQAQRTKYENNLTGQSMAYVRSMWGRVRLRRAIMKGKYLEALVEAEQILMRNPWDLGTHLAMAETFQELEWSDHALWTLEQIRPTYPKEPKVNRPLARLYEKRGNFNQAIALWDLVRKADPDDVEAQRKGKDLAASATIAKGRYEDAVKGESPTPLVQEEDDGEEEETKPTTKKAEPRVPREAAAAQERIKNDPKNPNGYLQLAGVYRRADQFEQARATLKQGLVPTGNHFEIQQELLDLDIEPFRRDLAVAEEQLRKKPKDEELQQIRAKLTREINTRELDYFRRRVERNPTDTNSRFESGVRLLHIGQLEEAIKELQAIRNEPRFHGKALFYLGFSFKARNNWRLAQRNLEEALQHLSEKDGPLRKEAMYVLATGLADAGELDRAIELGCELANLDFNYKDISRRIEEWQTQAALIRINTETQSPR
jgi:tetratricopeptide (TPR) repeat protein